MYVCMYECARLVEGQKQLNEWEIKLQRKDRGGDHSKIEKNGIAKNATIKDHTFSRHIPIAKNET